MIEVLSRAVLARWTDLRLPGPRPTRLTFLLDAADERRHGCARFRAFRDGDPRPIFRGRIPRDGVARRDILAEYDMLSALADVATAGAGRIFPRTPISSSAELPLPVGRSKLTPRTPPVTPHRSVRRSAKTAAVARSRSAISSRCHSASPFTRHGPGDCHDTAPDARVPPISGAERSEGFA